MSLIDIMDKRISVRTFSQEVPTGELFDWMKRIITKERKGPFGNRYSFTLIDLKDDNLLEMGKMTSYGVIKDARFYIGGYAEPDDRSILDYGYCFQEVILELTVLELGTCWMGGTFGRSFISRILNLPEGKVIPAISPVGFSLEKRAFADKVTRFLAGSKNRKPHNKLFFNFAGGKDLQPVLTQDLRSPLDEVFESVRFAPSASNKQPWRIIIQDDLYHFYCDFDKKYNSMIKGFNIQSLDMGIALCHFTKAAEELRLGGKLSYSDPHFDNLDWKYILSWKVNR